MKTDLFLLLLAALLLLQTIAAAQNVQLKKFKKIMVELITTKEAVSTQADR